MDTTTARENMVAHLVGAGLIRSPRVRSALLEVPRDAFMDPALARQAYEDAPQRIAGGQTISAPHMVAMMAEALDIQSGDRLLEVGTGSGYHAAIYAHLVGPAGRVTTIEIIPELATLARQALANAGATRVEVRDGDGALGAPDLAPFDRISVAAAAPHVPKPLVDQLKVGGVLVIPVGSRGLQSLARVEKHESGVKMHHLGDVFFVPLTGSHGQGAPNPSSARTQVPGA